jgi:galactose mutarotase-like enzyme
MDYELKTASSKAKVQTKGAELFSFWANGTDYIWRGDPQYWSGRAPILFPSVGTLRNDQTLIDGRLFVMQKHGLARNSEFNPVHIEKTEAVFSLRSDERTRTEYPFDFELIVTHELTESGFSTKYLVKNTDCHEIFYGIGGHPAFYCPLYPDTAFTDYVIVFSQPEPGLLYSPSIDSTGAISGKRNMDAFFEDRCKIRLDYSLFVPDALILEDLRSKEIMLIHEASGRGIRFSMNGFTALGIWTPAGKAAPFICLEPWTAMSDHAGCPLEFSQKPGIQHLNPGDEKEYSYEMKIK